MWDIINYILSAVGLLSIVITIIRAIAVFSQKSEWKADVMIEEFPPDEDLDVGRGFYPCYYPDHPSRVQNEYATQNLFIPQNVVIKKAVLKEVEITEKDDDFIEKYKKIHVFKDITPDNPLCLVIERREAIPRYMLEWKSEYGGRCRYYFCDNLRDGDNSKRGFQYEYGFFAKARKIIGLS